MANKKSLATRLPQEQVLALALFGDEKQRKFGDKVLRQYNKRGRNKRSR